MSQFDFVAAVIGSGIAIGFGFLDMFPRRPLGELAERIVTSLRDEGGQWKLRGESVLIHKPTDIAIWHYLRAGDIELYQPESTKCFSRRERRAIWNAGQAWKKTAGLEQINATAHDAFCKLREHQSRPEARR